ncbi:MAG: PSD1 and planctomycete cytochrome C domain-containing protein [Isosphaeraceae bacterium]
MIVRRTAWILGIVLTLSGLSQTGAASAGPPVFETDARPVLKAYCLDCHGGSSREAPKGGLDLRLRRFVVKGGKSGPAIEPGKPDDSLLLDRIRAGEMPPGEKKVPPEQVAILERWIADGAPARRSEPTSLPPGIDITPEERSFWAFQPIKRPTPPASVPADRVRTPIDSFVLARLRERGVGFAADADRITLIRRVTLDLTGLPPRPEDVDAFLRDPSPDDLAYARLVDRLLASPSYGERWGRHWLDVAGYADSEGNGNDDTLRPEAFRYRDYVIRALNADKPLDRFILEQLAGDELVPRPWSNLTAEQTELLAATGFLRNVVDATATGAPDEPLAANQVVADALKVVGSSLLGLTVGCAQCHDHRYDPIPQVDYFRLRAVFEPAFDPSHWRRPVQRRVSLYTDADRARSAAIEAEAQKLDRALAEKTQKYVDVAFEENLKKFPEAQRAALRDAFRTPADKRNEPQKALLDSNPSANVTPGVLYQYNQKAADELKADAEKIAAKRAEKKPEEFVSVLDEQPGVVPETHLFHRGDHRQPQQVIMPGDLTIAAPEGARNEIPTKDPAIATSGRRIAYARHLTNGKHPLVGRVLVNRVWLGHFGRGLVDTPGDFGALGVRPSHPELLDWLASELVEGNWSLKHLHRLIVGSTVYRQASRRGDASDSSDVVASLYGRFTVRRLEAEVLRDRIQAVSGRLEPRMFGPPVPVAEDFVGQVLPANNSGRRSVYLQVRRTQPVSLLTAFDLPVMTVNCDRRTPSVSAPQSLMLMNSDFVLGQAEALAKRARGEVPSDFATDIASPFASRFVNHAAAWSYGFGSVDEKAQRVVGFTALPYWTGGSWQGGPNLPDPKTGYVLLSANGGHPGNDAQHAAVRRWTATKAGSVRIAGSLKHLGQCGDGVRGRLVSSRLGVVGTWKATRSEAATAAEVVRVEPGDTIDLVVDALAEQSCDSFAWPVTLTQGSARYASEPEFRGPGQASLPQVVAYAWRLAYARPITNEELDLATAFLVERIQTLESEKSGGDVELKALTSLTQQLLISNEFLYVD